MRLLKTIHGWLGVIVLPWVVIIGLTGLFLNHEGLVMGFLSSGGYDEAQFDTWPDPQPKSVASARALAEGLYPDQPLTVDADTSYHGREAAIFNVGDTQVIVALKTGHYWIKTDFRRVTYAPDGQVLTTKTYWESLFKRLHVRGWLSNRFGTWAADITAMALVVFGLTGIILFLAPRVRRLRNRRRMRSLG
ncbi:MAG: PepSY-associated TM helix domain-containing protein [Tabrizicola sp.]|nr:PepSY-associated TM helix domain-containing protein [Tabrizicola sp.]